MIVASWKRHLALIERLKESRELIYKTALFQAAAAGYTIHFYDSGAANVYASSDDKNAIGFFSNQLDLFAWIEGGCSGEAIKEAIGGRAFKSIQKGA